MTSFSSDKTLGGLSLIQWLDQKRWQSSGEWDWAKDLNSEETVLAHWLTYQFGSTSATALNCRLSSSAT